MTNLYVIPDVRRTPIRNPAASSRRHSVPTSGSRGTDSASISDRTDLSSSRCDIASSTTRAWRSSGRPAAPRRNVSSISARVSGFSGVPFAGFAFCTDDAVFRVSLDATLLRGERRVTDEARKRSAKGSRSRRSVLRRQARRAPSRCALRHGHRRAPIARHALASIFSSRAGLSHRIAVRSSCVRPGIDSTKSTGFMTAMPWGKSVPVTMRSTPTRSIRLRMIPG
jgi:hypothetical protein